MSRCGVCRRAPSTEGRRSSRRAGQRLFAAWLSCRRGSRHRSSVPHHRCADRSSGLIDQQPLFCPLWRAWRRAGPARRLNGGLTGVKRPASPLRDGRAGGNSASEGRSGVRHAMIAQYLEIKAANPALPLLPHGDFYELFFDDAETASRRSGSPHQARQASGSGHSDVRGSDPCCGRLSEQADPAWPSHRRMRADRGSCGPRNVAPKRWCGARWCVWLPPGR